MCAGNPQGVGFPSLTGVVCSVKSGVEEVELRRPKLLFDVVAAAEDWKGSGLRQPWNLPAFAQATDLAEYRSCREYTY